MKLHLLSDKHDRPCGDCVQRDLNKLGHQMLISQHTHAWRQPRGPERAIRDLIRGWASLADDNPPILENEQYGRYYRAQALAMRAMVETMPLGRFSKPRLRDLVIAIGESAGIDWQELDGYEDETEQHQHEGTLK